MKQEDRLLLALALTIGILFFWTALFQPPPGQEQIEKARAAGQQQSLPQAQLTTTSETTQELQFGDLKLGIGSDRGGIRTLEADGTTMLANADPGLLAIRLVKPFRQEVELTTRSESGRIVSESRNLGGLLVTRTIAPSSEGPFFSEVTVVLENKSNSPQTGQIQLLSYHPIQFSNPRDRQYQRGFVSVGGKPRAIPQRVLADTAFPGKPAWVTAQGRAHLAIVQPVPSDGMFHVEQSPGGAVLGWLESEPQALASGAQAQWKFRVYSGPLLLATLRRAGLEEAFSVGLFSGIAKLLLGILLWGHDVFQSYGWAIIFLSFSIWAVFFPLTWSSLRTMKVMSQVQPKLARLQKEHKNNPQKLNQEMMAIYREHRVNPLGGCLPMLLQLPIFWSLYQVLPRSPQLHGASFFLIRDLSAPDAIIRFHGTLPIVGSSINLLPFFMAAAMFIQQRFTSSFQQAVTEEQKAQQQIFKFMPILFCFLFYSVPSGLVLYWTTNTVLTLIQYTAFFKTEKS